MEKSKELQDALRMCKGDYSYPDIIDSSAGLIEVPEIGVAGIKSWDRSNKGIKRKAVLIISTWCGISSNAIHWYGKIEVQGVYTGTLGQLEKPKTVHSEDLAVYPTLNYKYDIKIVRPLTESEIQSEPDRWYAYDAGDMVQGYEDVNELIRDFKTILKARFTGDWDFYVQRANGNRELITV